MSRPDRLMITDNIWIPGSAVGMEFSRSSGPGGQNVNKVETRVTLRLPLTGTPHLSQTARSRLLEKLSPRLTKEGELLVHSELTRERGRNIEDAFAKLEATLKTAYHRDKKRKKTRPSRGAKERRLSAKRKNSEKKQGRRASFET